MRHLGTILATAVALTAVATPANAAILTFNGTATARGVVTPDLGCAPRSRGTIDPATSSGMSNLGAFTYGHSVCTSGPPGGPIDGTFVINFGSDGFFGSLSGTSAQNATIPTFFDFTLAYTILGGTGRFLNSTGAFALGPGSGADVTQRPSVITLNFVGGMINAPAVPEPGTWALMLIGFGAIGASMRGRHRVRAVAQTA